MCSVKMVPQVSSSFPSSIDPNDLQAFASPHSSTPLSGHSISSPPSNEWWTWPWFNANLNLFLTFSEKAIILLREALSASWLALHAWYRLGVLLGRPVLRLLLHLWRSALPYLQWFAKAFINHLKEQEPEVLLGYGLFLGALVGFFLLRRLLRRLRVWDRCRATIASKVALVECRYHQARNKLNQYSRRAAEAFPHVLFVVACLAVQWLFPAVTSLLSQKLVFNVLLLYLPAFASFHALESFPPRKASFPGSTGTRHAKPADLPSTSRASSTAARLAPTGAPSHSHGDDKHEKRLKECLSYWIVAASIVAAGQGLDQLWLRWTTKWVPWGHECFLYFLLWLHLPQGGGALLKHHLLPFLRRHLGGILALQSRRDALVRRLLSLAVFAHLLSHPTADNLALHVDEFFLVLPAAVLTFSPFAGWGLLFISLLFPVLASARALGEEGGKRPVGSKGTKKETGGRSQSPPTYSPRPWLQYWIVYALGHVIFQVLPIWPLVQMWVFLWVLLPDLAGIPFLPIKLDGRRQVYGLLSRLHRLEMAGAGGKFQGQEQANPPGAEDGEQQQHGQRDRKSAGYPIKSDVSGASEVLSSSPALLAQGVKDGGAGEEETSGDGRLVGKTRKE